MSDLQCPATILLLSPETAAVSDMGVLRLALVLFAEPFRAAAVSVSAQHGCETRAADIGDGAALAARIAEIADLYRGEQVAIVASAQAIRDMLRLDTPPRAAVTLAVDSDGWQLLSW